MAWNTPSTWTAGAVLTAAQLNAQVRDNFKAIGDPGTLFTPTWTASTADPTIGNGSLTGGYSLAGKRLWVWMRIVMGTTTSYGSGSYSLALPAGLTPVTGRWRLNGISRDESAPGFFEIVGVTSLTSGTLALLTPATTAGSNYRLVGPSTPFTFADADEIFISGELEVA